VRSTRRIRNSGRRDSSSASSRSTGSLSASSSNSDASTEIGRARDERPASRYEQTLASKSQSASEQVAARAQEAPPPAVRVEADDVVREQPVVDRAPDPLGQHAPEVRLGHGMCTKCASERVRRASPHEPRREIEVVVVEEDRRVGLALELGERRVRERRLTGT
jgi:hypothetical protein